MPAENLEKEPESSLDGLGERIRNLRNQQGMTLQELSNSSQVSIAMLSHIERSRSMPSIKVLDRIRMALSVPFSAFFEETAPVQAEKAERTVTRIGERPVLDFAATGLRKELLSPVRGTQLEMMLLRLSAHGHSGDEPWRRVGEKCGMVLEGRFELTIGSTRHVLEKGDAFQFDSVTPHSFRNLHNGETQVMWIIFSKELG